MPNHIYLTSGVTAPKLVERLKMLRHATIDTGTHRYDIPPNTNEETTNLITTICRFVVVGTGNPRSWYRVSG
ncbi:hypothetical protein [Corynebacterium striatum]|uniref:hypothetical protein n=1 Tax=Corynebacterium striatum TaxID=43770 RepID=UPI00254E310F|nr:hypothetical protein [Corynebacterium striatum]MDK7884956.1 hypothetical protein [Corynebacterium striatum]